MPSSANHRNKFRLASAIDLSFPDRSTHALHPAFAAEKPAVVFGSRYTLQTKENGAA